MFNGVQMWCHANTRAKWCEKTTGMNLDKEFKQFVFDMHVEFSIFSGPRTPNTPHANGTHFQNEEEEGGGEVSKCHKVIWHMSEVTVGNSSRNSRGYYSVGKTGDEKQKRKVKFEWIKWRAQQNPKRASNQWKRSESVEFISRTIKTLTHFIQLLSVRGELFPLFTISFQSTWIMFASNCNAFSFDSFRFLFIAAFFFRSVCLTCYIARFGIRS